MQPVPLATSLVLAVTVGAQAAPAPGLRVYGSIRSNETHLVDVKGNIVHTWTSSYLPGISAYVDRDGTLLRAISTGGGQNALPGAGGGVQRVAFDGRVLWDFRYSGPTYISHHDIQALPNGNVLLLVWEDVSVAAAIAAGRDPALITSTVFRPDRIVEIQPTGQASGTVVWQWRVMDHLIQDFDPSQANFGVVGDHPELVDVNFPADPSQSNDWNHCNGLDYDPVHDWVVVSARHQSEVWILDHGTTTAEAAGHAGGRRGKGGDLLYRWGNPASYRAGTAADQQLFFQHDPRFVLPGRPGAGHVTVFNNNWRRDRSAVFELELPLDAAGNFVRGEDASFGPGLPVWTYSAPGFFSAIVSSAERLPNGNTLVCSGTQGWLFEVTRDGQIVWEHHDTSAFALDFHAHYVDRSLWSDATFLSATDGGMVRFDRVVSTGLAPCFYFLLGSATGSEPGVELLGGHVPLNQDSLLEFTSSRPNLTPYWNQTLGYLPGGGECGSLLWLPPRTIPPQLVGLQLHFADALLDPRTLGVVAASNPVSLYIVP